MGARKNGARRSSRRGNARLLLQQQETARYRRLLEQAQEGPSSSELESELIERSGELQLALEQRDTRIAELESRLSQVADAERVLEEQKASMAKLQAEAQAWMQGEQERVLGELRRELQQAQKAEAEAQSRAGELETRLASEQESARRARASEESLQAQATSLETDLGNLQEELSSAQERLAALEHELRDTPARVQAEARERFELEKQPLIEQQATLMATLAEESGKRRQLEQELEQARAMSAQLERLKPLQDELDQTRAAVARAESQAEQLRQRISQLEQEVKTVEARGQAALDKEMEANDRVMLKMEEEILTRDRRIAELGG